MHICTVVSIVVRYGSVLLLCESGERHAHLTVMSLVVCYVNVLLLCFGSCRCCCASVFVLELLLV